jgi:hypothetical protein
MNKFIYRTFLFSLIPLIIILSLDFFARNQSSLYKEKHEGALKNKDFIEIIILGNSHAHTGVDPRGFDLFTYNLANVAQSLYFDKRITLSLLPHLKKLKYVFISIDYHSLYSSSQGIRDIWSYYAHGVKHNRYDESKYLLADISPTLFGYTPKVVLSFLKKKIVNRLKYGKDVIDFDVGTGVNIKDTIVNGFISFDGHRKSVFTPERYKKRIHAFDEGIQTSDEKDEVLEDLNDFLEILLNNNITPILFTAPTYREYNKYLEESVVNNNEREIVKLCEKYNIKYLNFMNSDLFEKEDFYNADHLNKQGAKKLAKIMNSFIIDIENRSSKLQ